MTINSTITIFVVAELLILLFGTVLVSLLMWWDRQLSEPDPSLAVDRAARAFVARSRDRVNGPTIVSAALVLALLVSVGVLLKSRGML